MNSSGTLLLGTGLTTNSLCQNFLSQPNLVILRLNRAALMARWSPLGNKFAITSGAKSVCVCYYEQENNWWGQQ